MFEDIKIRSRGGAHRPRDQAKGVRTQVIIVWRVIHGYYFSELTFCR